MDSPLISVILPVYGVEPYLNQCVDSLINQTYRNIEIILVDDGSKDHCPQMIDDWARKDKRIVPIHKANGGQSSARNYGLEIAKGEYITFVDSDDWLEDGYCAKLLGSMQRYDAEIGVIGFRRVYNNHVVNSKFFINCDCIEYPCVPDQAVKYFLEGSIAVWGKMYQAKILKDIRFPEGRLAEEYEFQLKALQQTNVISFCNMNLYNYRIRGDSDAHSIKPKYLLDYIQAVDEAYQICKKHFCFETDYCRSHLAGLIYEYISAKQYGDEELQKRQDTLERAISSVGGVDNLLNVILEPENVVYYTYNQFSQFMSELEKRKVQSDYRKVFRWGLLHRYKHRFFIKYLPSWISLKYTVKLLTLERKGG